MPGSGWTDGRSDATGEAPARPFPRLRRFLRVSVPLASAGLVVGVVVSAMAASIGLASCGPTESLFPLDPAPVCHELVLSLAVRTGLMAGIVTVFFALFSMGLNRTAEHLDDERYRRMIERARRRRSE